MYASDGVEAVSHIPWSSSWQMLGEVFVLTEGGRLVVEVVGRLEDY